MSVLSDPRKLKYIFQEMIDTERDYVKSLQYIMDVSKLFLSAGVSLTINGLSSIFSVFFGCEVLPLTSYLFFLL